MKKKINNHDVCVEKIKSIFNDAGFYFVDEDKNGKNEKPTPDLKCDESKIVIEVKTFQGGKENKDREELLKEKINRDGSYWPIDNYNTFNEHIKKARKKFKEYPDYASIVIFVDFMKFDIQNIEDLFFEKSYVITAFGDENLENVKNGIERKCKNIAFDHNKNKEIGAVAQLYFDKKLIIIHNSCADDNRKVSFSVGEKLGAIQKIYSFRDNGPRIEIAK